MFGAGGGTSSYEEIHTTDLILLWGSNARNAHPIFFHHLMKGVRNGAKMYAIDPRRSESAQWADVWLGIDVGSDIALANTVGREIIAAGLANQNFINHSTSGFDAIGGRSRAGRWIGARLSPGYRPTSSDRWPTTTPPPKPPKSVGRWASPNITPQPTTSCP